MPKAPTILIIDDEESIRYAFRRFLQARGYKVIGAATAAEGLAACRDNRPGLVFLDVRLPDANGLDLLERLLETAPATRVVVMTAYGTVDTVLEAVRRRAYDYLPKPVDLPAAAHLAEQAFATPHSPGEHDTADAETRHGIVGASEIMQDVFRRIGRAARSDSSVLILGETGTGKELAARALHELSDRAAKPFVPVNCGAIPENLIEGELFGFSKGAFTGADRDKPGRFETANHGTLFLDEVGELPPAAQVKVLRFLDSHAVERLGSVASRALDVRIVAATNRDLVREQQDGAFRSDLYFRLAVIEIELPPLRSRLADIPLLVRHFLRQNGAEPGLMRSDTLDVLTRYDWPGNIRELRNAVEHSLVGGGGDAILPRHLPPRVRAAPASTDRENALQHYLESIRRTTPAGLLEAAVTPVERALINAVLSECGGNQSRTAKLLGIHRNTLRQKLQELAATDNDSKGATGRGDERPQSLTT